MFAKGSCLPLKSARRSATVTSSAPLASSASRIFSGEANFPVPRIRRERNSCPAMVNGRFTEDISRQHRRLSVECREFYERAKWHGRPARASPGNYHSRRTGGRRSRGSSKMSPLRNLPEDHHVTVANDAHTESVQFCRGQLRFDLLRCERRQQAVVEVAPQNRRLGAGIFSHQSFGLGATGRSEEVGHENKCALFRATTNGLPEDHRIVKVMQKIVRQDHVVALSRHRRARNVTLDKFDPPAQS